MPEKGIWLLTVPLAGIAIAAAFVGAVVFVVATFAGAPQDRGAKTPRARSVPVHNLCSAAIQVGWVSVDPRVPFDKDAASHFFPGAFYSEGSEWPRVDEYAKYTNQSGVLEPGRDDVLAFDEASYPKRRLLVLAVYDPKDGRGAGTPAFERVEVFDIGDMVPHEVVLEARDGDCLPRPPLDRRYQF
ncbi:MAG: hypothetical protein C4318_08295 [Acidimicrobiia bacterium]